MTLMASCLGCLGQSAPSRPPGRAGEGSPVEERSSCLLCQDSQERQSSGCGSQRGKTAPPCTLKRSSPARACAPFTWEGRIAIFRASPTPTPARIGSRRPCSSPSLDDFAASSRLTRALRSGRACSRAGRSPSTTGPGLPTWETPSPASSWRVSPVARRSSWASGKDPASSPADRSSGGRVGGTSSGVPVRSGPIISPIPGGSRCGPCAGLSPGVCSGKRASPAPRSSEIRRFSSRW